MLLLTILAGYVWGMESDRLSDMHGDPLFLVTFAAWLLYTIGLGARYLAGWRGRFTVYLSVCGFAFLIVSLVAATLIWPSMHSVR
jgi:ABC-type transport system involved in cytochrome c biogenesis permease subunit